jgi:hypothetical protein
MTEMNAAVTRGGGTARVLTALAGLVTALGAAFAGYQGGLFGASESSSPVVSPVVVNMTVPGAAAPEAPVDSGSMRLEADAADQILESDSGSDSAEQMIDACAQGDLEACESILITLSTDCADGYGGSCDALFLVSPEGSDYETYGATCGGRFGFEYAGSCGEL